MSVRRSTAPGQFISKPKLCLNPQDVKVSDDNYEFTCAHTYAGANDNYNMSKTEVHFYALLGERSIKKLKVIYYSSLIGTVVVNYIFDIGF